MYALIKTLTLGQQPKLHWYPIESIHENTIDIYFHGNLISISKKCIYKVSTHKYRIK